MKIICDNIVMMNSRHPMSSHTYTQRVVIKDGQWPIKHQTDQLASLIDYRDMAPTIGTPIHTTLYLYIIVFV